MKRLPLWQRPLGAKKILEVGGGHDPYEGVTHAVDKFPQDNAQRGGNFTLPSGAKFFEGDLENLPFPLGDTFDFLYASHVFEHVTQPEKAINEVNRLVKRGYIETPSPLREQLACPVPFDEKNDFHTLFCWSLPGTLHVVKKSKETVGEFPDTPAGKVAKILFHIQREEKIDLEPMLPRAVKTTRLLFNHGVKLQEHVNFSTAAAVGVCAFEPSVSILLRNLSFPLRLRSRRFRALKDILKAHGAL
jgi:SAM-dependent methyltransferase